MHLVSITYQRQSTRHDGGAETYGLLALLAPLPLGALPPVVPVLEPEPLERGLRRVHLLVDDAELEGRVEALGHPGVHPVVVLQDLLLREMVNDLLVGVVERHLDLMVLDGLGERAVLVQVEGAPAGREPLGDLGCGGGVGGGREGGGGEEGREERGPEGHGDGVRGGSRRGCYLHLVLVN